jgi:hypothetical protein
LAGLAKSYPGDEGLEARLRELDELLAQRSDDAREENLRRLMRFRDRVDVCDQPDTLRRFADLAAPFVDAHRDEPAFASVLEEMRDLYAIYEKAARLVAENRSQEALQFCREALRRRPGNLCFRALKEQAKIGDELLGPIIATQVERDLDAEALEEQPPHEELGVTPDFPDDGPLPRVGRHRAGVRIAITEEAWNHLKTGVAATAALLLVVLLFASHAHR